ncbi:MAG: hypothetical protein WD060_09320 [Pirellulales bacterium]
MQVSRSDDELMIRDAIGKEGTIPTADIDEESAGTSLMPAGLIDSLTREEFADLVPAIHQSRMRSLERCGAGRGATRIPQACAWGFLTGGKGVGGVRASTVTRGALH